MTRKSGKSRRIQALAVIAAMLLFSGCAAMRTGEKSKTKPADVEPFGVRAVLTNEMRGRIHVETAVPVFTGFSAAADLNRRIKKLSDDGTAQLKAGTADLSPTFSAGANMLYFGSFFDYSRNGDILSVWITSENYSGGAHGTHWIDAFTLNTRTGKFYASPASLFRDPEAGVKKITDGILSRISAQPDGYLPDAAQASQTVEDKKGDYKFYLDGGDLVVYFDLYEITPYAVGIPKFAFPVKDLGLEPALSSLTPAGKVRCNGADAAFRHPVFSGDDGIYLPLQDTAAVLGRTVTQQNGKYAVSGKTVGVKSLQGTAYAPMTFFTNELGDFIVYDGEILRFFRTADGAEKKDSGSPPPEPVLLGQY